MSKNNPIWQKAYGDTLKQIFALYSLDYKEFCEQYKISESTFRYWRNGNKLPQSQYMSDLKKFLNCDKLDDDEKLKIMYNYIGGFMRAQGAENVFSILRKRFSRGRVFLGEVLEFYWNFSKGNISPNVQIDMTIEPTGKTQVVVFDFDGTLTVDKYSNRTTWERIWECLEYPEQACPQLHKRYSNGEITHIEWCKITENKFKERNLHKENVEKIASEIKMIKGVRETFETLSNQGIKIYIVSGSIDIVIRKVLGDINQYVDEMKSNHFKFNSAGFLTQIVGTKYDFEGKADLILQISDELKIAPSDILFVGNSLNDEYVYRSGAKTLCINAKLTNPHNRDVWNECIEKCDDLKEIIKYL